ncbi:MAG TPA: translocation/assembly module TamB domain-containing protein, partial [Geminicoccaceae bacterium]
MVRRVGIGLAILVVGLIVIIVSAFGIAQTAVGQRLIARGLGAALDGTAEIDGLSGTVPFDFRLDRLALIEEGEPWLSVEGFAFAWSPTRLLDGVLEISSLTARRIEVADLPAGGGPEPEAPDDEPFSLPELPETLPLVVLDRLEVGELVLAEPVLGERAVFHIEGHARTTDLGRAVELALAVARTDQATAAAELNATVALDPPALNLDLQASEQGRLIEQLAGLGRESGDFNLRLTGNGPLRAWRGELEAGGAGIGSAAGVVTLALLEQPRLGLELRLRPSAAVVPDAVEPVLGETLEVALDVTQTGAQQIRIGSLALDAGAASLAAEAALDFERRLFEVDGRIGVARIAALTQLAGTPLQGDATLKVMVAGPFLQPAGRLEIEAGDLEAADLRLAAVSAGLDFETLADLDAEPAAAVSLEGRLTGLALPEAVGLPPRDLTVALDARRPPGAEAEIEKLRVSDGNATIEVDGTADLETLAARLDVRLAVARLAELTGAVGQAIGGRLEISGPVRVSGDAARIETELVAVVEELSGLPPDLAAIAGERLRAEIVGAFVPDDAVVLERLVIENPALEATAEGRVGLDGARAVEAELALALRELAVLEPLAGAEFAGALAATAEAGGTLEAPVLKLTLGGANLTLAGRPVWRLALAADAEGLEPVSGTVRLEVAMPRLEATLASDYRLEERVLALSATRFSGSGVEVEGNARVDLASGITTGRLDGRIEELARLDALIPMSLRGRLDLEVRLEDRGGGQAVAAAATLNEVRGPFGAFERAALQADLQDALAEPRIQAGLTVTGFRQEATRVDRLEAEASGSPDQLTVDLAAEGTATAPFDLESRIQLALAEATRVRVDSLGGTFGDQPLRLRQPLTVALAGEAIDVSALDLTFAGGRLRGDARIGPGPVAAEVRLDGLPLENLQSLGAPPLRGTASAALDLDGRSNDPTLTLEVRIPDLRSPDPAYGDVPPLDLALDARLAGRRLEASVRATGLTDRPITGRLAAPLLVDLEHFAFEVPETGRLGGGLEADVQLRRVADLLALDGQRLEGQLEARLELAGTVAEPVADGRIELDDGRYENGTTGTVLTNVTLRATIDADRLAVQELSARDGGRGRLTGSGRIDLDPAQNYPLAVQVNLKDATLVRRDDVEATLGGQVRLEGDLQRSAVRGRVVVERAEIGLPDPSGGPDIAVLDVEEVGRGVEAPAATGGDDEEDERVVALDLT